MIFISTLTSASFDMATGVAIPVESISYKLHVVRHCDSQHLVYTFVSLELKINCQLSNIEFNSESLTEVMLAHWNILF